MKLSHYVDRVEKSAEFRKFKKENENAYLCAGFFVLDFESGKNQYQVDYFMPKKKKIATFMLNNEVKLKIEELLNMKKMEKLGDVKIDVEALKGILEDEMKNKTITEKINKIIAVIQKIEGKETWVLNCVLSGLNLLKVHIEDSSGTILKFEKANFMNFVKKI